jgi:hypothetical protein
MAFARTEGVKGRGGREQHLSGFCAVSIILRLEYGKRNTERERSICRSGKVLVQLMIRLPSGSITRRLKQTPAHDFSIHPSEIPEEKRQIILQIITLLISACPEL